MDAKFYKPNKDYCSPLVAKKSDKWNKIVPGLSGFSSDGWEASNNYFISSISKAVLGHWNLIDSF